MAPVPFVDWFSVASARIFCLRLFSSGVSSSVWTGVRVRRILSGSLPCQPPSELPEKLRMAAGMGKPPRLFSTACDVCESEANSATTLLKRGRQEEETRTLLAMCRMFSSYESEAFVVGNNGVLTVAKKSIKMKKNSTKLCTYLELGPELLYEPPHVFP
eukprot:1617112-Rhodomonas_salina.1